MDSTIVASLIGATATTAAALITFFATRRSVTRQLEQQASATDCRFEHLSSREAVLLKAEKLIASAEVSVIDTTWGSPEENYTTQELRALGKYLDAKQRVLNRGQVSYKEIYSPASNDSHRTDRIEAERTRVEPAKNYSAKLLEGIDDDFPMLDFLVVDHRKVILSCLSKDTARPEYFYLYAETSDLAGLFTQYFQICWDRAVPLRNGISQAAAKSSA